MKNRIIILLLWLITGMLCFLFNEYSLYQENLKGKEIIEKRVEKLEKEKLENKIIKIKEEYNKKIKDKETKKDIMKVYSFTLIDYSLLYKQVYNEVINTEYIKDIVWYKDFEISPINKRLVFLRENSIVFKIKNEETKEEIILNEIPIDINCEKINISYCPKKIITEYNEIYNSNKNYLKIKKKNHILTKEDIIKLMKWDYINFYNINEI